VDIKAEHQTDHLETLKKLRIVIRAAQRHSGWIEKQCGVTGTQLWIMQELAETPGLRVGEIAARLAIHQTTTSNLLDALEKRGYVVKARSAEDQRVVRLALTAAGGALVERAPKPARGLLTEALRKLDQNSLLQLKAGLQALSDVIEHTDEGHALQPMSFIV
jgi:MarR family transcriptional regulator, organic hydroperoxide resistance regulator